MRPTLLYVVHSLSADLCVACGHRVLAQVDGKMVKPPPERPLEGMITIHSELSPMAANEYEPGR